MNNQATIGLLSEIILLRIKLVGFVGLWCLTPLSTIFLQNGLHQHLSLLFLEQECHLSKKKKTQNIPFIAFTLQIHLIISISH
jgi:hypothetical protein